MSLMLAHGIYLPYNYEKFMSEFTTNNSPGNRQTVFEKAWQQDDNGLYLFRSEKHAVMALAALYPRLPLQVVVAPNEGEFGTHVHFSQLPRSTKRKLHEVADAMDEKMFTLLQKDQRVVTEIVPPRTESVTTHTEGFGVPDHAHIVLFAAERKEGELQYNGAALGEDAVARTVKLMRFNQKETAQLNQRLSHLPVW
jgi:diadenosine tetraphosphate (Ap4A) HIT family hydrolase